MNYIFTKNGERKVENFIQSCIEKREKIINEGIDTGDLVDNAAKLSINDVLLSINYFHASNLRKHTYSVLITDHFRGELTLIYEADFIKCEKQSIIDDAINKEHLAEDIVDVFENLLDEKISKFHAMIRLKRDIVMMTEMMQRFMERNILIWSHKYVNFYKETNYGIPINQKGKRESNIFYQIL